MLDADLCRTEKSKTMNDNSFVIGPDVRIWGTVSTDQRIDVFGFVDGSLSGTEVYVSQRAMVTGDIIATRVLVQGQVLGKVGAEPDLVRKEAERALDRLPQVSGGQVYPAAETVEVLEAAQRAADRMKDEFVSTEHLLLAVLEGDTKAAELVRTLRGKATGRRAGNLSQVWLQEDRVNSYTLCRIEPALALDSRREKKP